MSLLEQRYAGVPAARPVPKAARAAAVGDRVRVWRDELAHPSKGTWPDFRGRTGTIVEINVDHRRPRLTEYGVIFSATRKRPNRPVCAASGQAIVTWFKVHEIRVICSGGAAPTGHADGFSGRAVIGRSTPERCAHGALERAS